MEPMSDLTGSASVHPGEEEIRGRAYAIWEREGRPEGRHHEHWQQAERELLSNSPQERPEKEPEDLSVLRAEAHISPRHRKK